MMTKRKLREAQFLSRWIGSQENLQADPPGTQHTFRPRNLVIEEIEEQDSQENSFDDRLEQAASDDTMASKQLADTVSLNVPVVVRDLHTNEEITFTIVDGEAVDPDHNRISFDSPVGFALLWKRIGDSVKVNLPGGQAHYQIVRRAAEIGFSVAV